VLTDQDRPRSAIALMWAVPPLRRGAALERADTGYLDRLGRSLAGETSSGVAVLLGSAVLVDSKPPPLTDEHPDGAGGAISGGMELTSYHTHRYHTILARGGGGTRT